MLYKKSALLTALFPYALNPCLPLTLPAETDVSLHVGLPMCKENAERLAKLSEGLTRRLNERSEGALSRFYQLFLGECLWRVPKLGRQHVKDRIERRGGSHEKCRFSAGGRLWRVDRQEEGTGAGDW